MVLWFASEVPKPHVELHDFALFRFFALRDAVLTKEFAQPESPLFEIQYLLTQLIVLEFDLTLKPLVEAQ